MRRRSQRSAGQRHAQHLRAGGCVQRAVLVGVRVSVEHVDGHRRTFVGRRAVVVRNRRVVDLRDRERNRLGRGQPFAVGDRVGEALHAVPVGKRLVGDVAAGDRRRALDRARIDRKRQNIAVCTHVHVADKSRFQNRLGAAVLGNGQALVNRCRVVVDRGYVDREFDRRFSGVAVLNL
ncbi:hypothetical protein SDC9_130928 [bioreactor metagenome]|uniref:Uncharacterized protein n=1 Tax=bioreactor metagenome TaxID=1076179 RepID=A0A645D3T1_9ZZZZ